MTARILFSAALLLAGASIAHAQDNMPRPGPSPQARNELPFNDCLRTDRINEWAVVDTRTVAVRNGPNHFVVKTSADCPRMDLGGGIRFKSSNSDKAMGEMRICGGIDEKILRRNEPPCQVQSVRTIDKATFESMKKSAKRRGSGAQLPSPGG